MEICRRAVSSSLSEAEREGKLKAGDLILMIAFGAGLTYGGALLRWGRD
jgi:3-oxoacyl-[acyl-carrier-protein] synthase-3